MQKYFEKVSAFIEAHREEMLAKWKTFVNMEDFFADVEATRRCRDWYIHELEELGFVCTVHDGMAPGYTEPFTAILGADRPGKPVIFGGHLDTVQPMGSFGDLPFRIENGKAFGPGALDMKGGLVIALYVVKALNELGYDAHPIKFVIDCEEESSHVEPDNNVTQFFIDESRGGLCCFDMETGNITNRLCVGRKSKYEWFATVHGVGGHAGNEFAKGRNALHEAVLAESLADEIHLIVADLALDVHHLLALAANALDVEPDVVGNGTETGEDVLAEDFLVEGASRIEDAAIADGEDEHGGTWEFLADNMIFRPLVVGLELAVVAPLRQGTSLGDDGVGMLAVEAEKLGGEIGRIVEVVIDGDDVLVGELPQGRNELLVGTEILAEADGDAQLPEDGKRLGQMLLVELLLVEPEHYLARPHLLLEERIERVVYAVSGTGSVGGEGDDQRWVCLVGDGDVMTDIEVEIHPKFEEVADEGIEEEP